MVIRTPSDVETVFELSDHAALQAGWCEKMLAGINQPNPEKVEAAQHLCEAWGCEAVVYPVVPEVCGVVVTLRQLVTWFLTDSVPAQEDAKRRVWHGLWGSPCLELRLTEKPAWRVACWGIPNWGEEMCYLEQIEEAAGSNTRPLSATESLWEHLVIGWPPWPNERFLNTADTDKGGDLVVEVGIHQGGTAHFTIGIEYNLFPAESWPGFILAVGFD